MLTTRTSLDASAAREDTRPPTPPTLLAGGRLGEASLPGRPPSSVLRPSRQAFTLIEMLIVISIISVLLGLLYGAIERAQKFSRRTITFTELKSIESAWKQYYAYYHAWPSNDVANLRLTSGEDLGFIIDAPIARMLQGVRETSSELWRLNSESIPFIEFSRYSATTRSPVNPFKALSADPGDTSRSYKVLFDTNGDRQIEAPSGDAQAPTNTTVIASVAVWTIIPATRQTSRSGDSEGPTEVVFGSWEPFSAR